jgi:predicted ATPase
MLGGEYEALLERHRSILREAFARHAGYEVGTEGDSFFVVFASPLEALRAAAEGQQVLKSEIWPPEAPVRVRMGLHMGEATLRDGDYVGIEIHRAARVGAAAHGGQVLVSGALVAVLGDRLPEGFGLRELGNFRLKDFDAGTRLFQLTAPGLTADFAAPNAPPISFTNLPERRSSFIGRRHEREAIRRALHAHRLVTLTGPGGSGKTSLAVELAREQLADYPDGAWLAELAALRDPDFVAATVGHILGVSDPTRPAIDVLTAYLAERRLLLVLDNLEQLLPDVARLVDRLLEAAVGLRVLATSREPLHIPGEQELGIPPLELPDFSTPPGKVRTADAVRLFVERARSVDAHFTLTIANREAVMHLVRRLDGLPLAIELAAARAKVLSPGEMLQRLSGGTGQLGQVGTLRPERQQTLRDAIGWSYQLLMPAEQAFFARLSVFAGGCSLESVEEVCNPAAELVPDTLDALGSLIDKSLMRRMATAIESRFEMLATIRDFARERLEVLDPTGMTAARHAHHVLGLAESAATELTKADDRWRRRLALEIDNVRSALSWAINDGDSEVGMRLCVALWRFWQIRALLSEGREWCDRVLVMAPSDAPSELHARALMAAGSLAYWQRDTSATNRMYRAALAEAEAVGGDRLLADALTNLNFQLSLYPETAADDQEIEIAQRRIVELSERLHDPIIRAYTDFARAGRLLADGQIEEADRRVKQTRALLEASGDVFLAGSANSIAGGTALIAGDLAEALTRSLASAEYFHAIGDQIALQMQFRNLATVAAQLGQNERAARLHGFAARLVADTGGVRFTPPFEGEDALEIVQGAIGPQRAEEEWMKGQRMGVDEAMAVARAVGQAMAQADATIARRETGTKESGR